MDNCFSDADAKCLKVCACTGDSTTPPAYGRQSEMYCALIKGMCSHFSSLCESLRNSIDLNTTAVEHIADELKKGNPHT